MDEQALEWSFWELIFSLLFPPPGADHHHVHLCQSEWVGGVGLPLCSQGPHHPVPATEECQHSESGHHPLQRHHRPRIQFLSRYHLIYNNIILCWDMWHYYIIHSFTPLSLWGHLSVTQHWLLYSLYLLANHAWFRSDEPKRFKSLFSVLQMENFHRFVSFLTEKKNVQLKEGPPLLFLDN